MIDLAVIRDSLTFTHGPLYAACEPGALQAYIWSMPDKRTRYAFGLEELISHAESVAQQNPSGVYVSQAAFDGSIRYRSNERPKADSSFAVGHFWSDFDIEGPAHKKANLPPDLDTLLSWLKVRWPWYSRLDASGHGAYLHMLHEAPVIFADAAERERYATLGVRLNAYWIEAARRDFGWAVDSTADHARVLRVMGTANRKLPEAPVATYIIEQRAERFSYPQIVALLAESIASLSVAPERSTFALGASGANGEPSRALVVSGTANPRAPLSATEREDKTARIRALCVELVIVGRPVTTEQIRELGQLDPLIPQIWEKTCKAPEDNSHSGWDFYLAQKCVRVKLADQFICDVLVAYRNKWQQEPKTVDYFARTITEARRGPSVTIAKVADFNSAAVLIDDIEVKRAGWLRSLSEWLSAEVERIEKHGISPARYYLKIRDQAAVTIGTQKDLASSAAIVYAMRDLTQRPIPMVKAKDWSPLLEAILGAAELVELGEEATPTGEVMGWLNGHVGMGLQAVNESTPEMKNAFYKGGRVYVFADKLLQYVINTYRHHVNKAELVSRLKLAGCEPVRYDFHINGQHICRSVWRLPDWPDMDYKAGDPSDEAEDIGPIPADSITVADTFINDVLGE